MNKSKIKTLLLAVLMCVVGGVNVWGDVVRPTYVDANVQGYSGYTASRLVDGTSIKWCSIFQNPTWITVQANNTVLKGYELYNGDDTQTYTGRRWKNWTVEGSNDNSTWTTIQTVTDASMSTTNNGRNMYIIDNNTTQYNYYRFTISANYGDGCIQMSDLKLITAYDGNSFSFKGMKTGRPGSGYTSACNTWPYWALNNSSWGGTCTHTENGITIGQFFDMNNSGTSSGNAKNMMCSYFQNPMTIPAYSKLVRKATFTIAFYTNRHFNAAGLYVFDTESDATGTYVDMSWDQGQTKPAGHIISKLHTNINGQWANYSSGTVDITFDNSTGASKSDISKWFTFVQVSSNGGSSGVSGQERAEWMMNSNPTDVWTYYKYVNYNGNNATSGSMSQSTFTATNDNTVTGNLTENAFSRTGYTFLGWSEDQNATTATYTDKAEISVNKTDKGVLNLYAVWQATPSVDDEGAVKFSDNVPVTPEVIDKAIADTKTTTNTAFDLSNTTVTAANAKTIVEKIRGTEKSANAFVFLPKVDNLDDETKATKNVITTDGTNSTCQNLELVDGTPMVTALVGKEFTATNASYKRTVSNNWGTICLPYDVKNDETTQYYKLSEVKESEGKMYFTAYTDDETIPANTPAVFQRKNGATQIAPSASNASIDVDLDENSTGQTWYLVGTYKSKTLNKQDDADCYYIAQNKFWQVKQSENGVTVGAYRAYFTTTNPNQAKSFTLFAWDGDNATEIGTIDADGNIQTKQDGKYVQDGKVVIMKNGKKYNAIGQEMK